MPLRLQQLLVVLVGLLLAAGMAVLGLWQLGVYRSQGAAAARQRAAAPPVTLSQLARPGEAIREGFGRSVSFTGAYVSNLQFLLPAKDANRRFRVLTGLRQPDGSLVPVLRGEIAGGDPPAPPAGPVAQTGVLLPTEERDPTEVGQGQLSSIRIPLLAQRWPGPLIGGYVSLSASDARAQGLIPAAVTLPQETGRLRNGAYALQWWLFAAFAVFFAVRIAADLSLREQLAADVTPDADPADEVERLQS